MGVFDVFLSICGSCMIEFHFSCCLNCYICITSYANKDNKV